MSNFLILYSTGLLYLIMHKMIISNPTALIFGSFSRACFNFVSKCFEMTETF